MINPKISLPVIPGGYKWKLNTKSVPEIEMMILDQDSDMVSSGTASTVYEACQIAMQYFDFDEE